MLVYGFYLTWFHESHKNIPALINYTTKHQLDYHYETL